MATDRESPYSLKTWWVDTSNPNNYIWYTT